MPECNYNSYRAWWYCSPEGRILELHEQPFYTERQALSRSLRKGYENLKNKSLEEMAELFQIKPYQVLSVSLKQQH
ncbi:Uncharacterised protein [Proteus vulgaris]|uniref:hypothetical protein n=1 Tax=Proteus vulgaris TaxID=585 RepID=UPI000E021421|nr:hypothetical protein [Proteus vulgaris]SUC22643.1 Uncharacterised protein [Proteus vulgaris]